MSKKDVVKKEESNLPAMPQGGWDDGDVGATDVLVPMLLIAQGSSDIVKKLGKAKPGDAYESVGKAVLGDKDNPLQFVPFNVYKSWIVCEVVKGRPEFRRVEPWDNKNPRKYEREETRPDGTVWRYYEALNFFVLLEKELKEGKPTPYLLTFKASALYKGKTLVNYKVKAAMQGQPLCSGVFKLNAELKTKGSDAWFVPSPEFVCPTNHDWMRQALEWLSQLKTSVTATVDHSGLDDENDVTPIVAKNEVRASDTM